MFEALLSLKEPLKVKDLSKFWEVNFLIFENSSAVNVLSDELSLLKIASFFVFQEFDDDPRDKELEMDDIDNTERNIFNCFLGL